MKLTKKQIKELEAAARPLMQWLSDNCHPPCFATVDYSAVSLSEFQVYCPSSEFVKD